MVGNRRSNKVMGKRSISQIFHVNGLGGAQRRECSGQRKQLVLDTWLVSGNEGGLEDG